MTMTHTQRALPRVASPNATKGVQIGIWVSTGLFAAMFTFSGVMLIVGPPEVATIFRHLGYPDYFRELLGVAKLLGLVALVLRFRTPTLREWAYAGSAFTCIAAAVSHVMSGDPAATAVSPLFALALLMTSYSLRRRISAGDRASA